MDYFDSLNSYQTLQVIKADDPQGLVDEIKKIKTPMTIVSIVAYGNRHAAYVITDTTLKIKKLKSKGE